MPGVLVVTGGSGGIGRAIASLGAQAGYAVAVTYRSNRGGADAVVNEIRQSGGRAIAAEAELGSEDAIMRLFRRVDNELGTVTALVNNAAEIGWEGRVDEVKATDLNRLWAVNVTSYFLCAREAVRRMSTAHGGAGGAIVNVSSLSGRTGGRDRRVHYAASKGPSTPSRSDWPRRWRRRVSGSTRSCRRSRSREATTATAARSAPGASSRPSRCSGPGCRTRPPRLCFGCCRTRHRS